MQRAEGRLGFTLMEVLVALVVGGIVLLTAERVLAVLRTQSVAIVDRERSLDREANGRDVLCALVGRIEVGAPGTVPFVGTPDSVHFSSWCETASGWLERCTVTLTLQRQGSSRVLIASLDGRTPLVLESDTGPGAFRYLESAANGGIWFQRWGTGITAPLALGIITQHDGRPDTTLLPIGPRG